MTNCTKRRKTKHPFCKDEPKCYWGKKCKNRTLKRRSLQDSKRLSKLDTIINRLSLIEKKVRIIEKNTSKFLKKKHPRLSLTTKKSLKVKKSNPNNYMNNVNDKIGSNNTTVSKKIVPRVNPIYDNPKFPLPTNSIILSPEARQKIREL